MNLYAYCGNNPVMCCDPTGHFWSTIWKSIGSFFENIFGAGVLLSESYEAIKTETLFYGNESGTSHTKVICGDISKPISFYAKNASDWWKFWEYKIGIQINIMDGGLNFGIGVGEVSLAFANEHNSLELIAGINKIGYTLNQGVSFGNYTAETYYHEYIRTLPSALAVAAVVGVAYLCGTIGIPAIASVAATFVAG